MLLFFFFADPERHIHRIQRLLVGEGFGQKIDGALFQCARGLPHPPHRR